MSAVVLDLSLLSFFLTHDEHWTICCHIVVSLCSPHSLGGMLFWWINMVIKFFKTHFCRIVWSTLFALPLVWMCSKECAQLHIDKDGNFKLIFIRTPSISILFHQSSGLTATRSIHSKKTRKNIWFTLVNYMIEIRLSTKL